MSSSSERLEEDSCTHSSNSDSDDSSELIIASTVALIAMNHYEKHMKKRKRRPPRRSGYQWVIDNLQVNSDCYEMFRMNRDVFDKLHDTLVESYGLKSTRVMSSVEALGMFLWMCGGPQSFVQVKNIFKRSKETISRKFNDVLECLNRLGGHNICPREGQSGVVHPRLQDSRFSPHFNNCIGAIDGTHVRVVVPANERIAHTGHHGYPTQNVMAICDFDTAHDSRVFNDTLNRYSDEFPHPPEGKFYLVDSGYPNRRGFLAPYKGQKYHIPEFQRGHRPSGFKETFNHAHSSLRNVIERSFGVLKMKWPILQHIPSFPVEKQKKIIIACIALHNFIRDNALSDELFQRCDDDEGYIPPVESLFEGGNYNGVATDDGDMCAFRDFIAYSLMTDRE